jgi:hypothetical protein
MELSDRALAVWRSLYHSCAYHTGNKTSQLQQQLLIVGIYSRMKSTFQLSLTWALSIRRYPDCSAHETACDVAEAVPKPTIGIDVPLDNRTYMQR